jgi:hypothetical protein
MCDMSQIIASTDNGTPSRAAIIYFAIIRYPFYLLVINLHPHSVAICKLSFVLKAMCVPVKSGAKSRLSSGFML